MRGLSPAQIFARPTAEEAWLGPAQKSALAHLAGKMPFRLLLGPRASGRSTLLALLERDLGRRATVLHVAGSRHDRRSLLSSLVRSTGLTCSKLSKAEQRNLFAAFVEQRRSQGQRIVVAVDDVDRLSVENCQEIEQLAALRLGDISALEIALTAPADCGGPLAQELRNIVGPRSVHELARLGIDEVDAYVAWRLSAFGLNGIFTRTAVHLVTRFAGGRFRSIDVLCQMALLVMRQRGTRRIDVRTVSDAVDALAEQHVKARRARNAWRTSVDPAAERSRSFERAGAAPMRLRAVK